MSDLVFFQKEKQFAWLTLNRPQVHNALSFDCLLQLRKLLAAIRDDRNIRVLLITGAGERTFCAGADLKERKTFTPQKTQEYVHNIGSAFAEIAALPQPTIAVLQGSAFGGGLELALACDLRIAADHVQMGLTETSLAIIPGAGGTQRLPQIVGVAKAKELIFTARRISAQEALQIGLLNSMTDVGQLTRKAVELAEEICVNGPLAVRAAKQAVDLSMEETSMKKRLDRERELYNQWVLPSKDRLEALVAFQEKRKPNFTGE